MDHLTLSKISDSLPENFPFYSFGSVSRASSQSSLEFNSLIRGKAGVAFQLMGEPAAYLVFLFDQGLDISMYSELANIIASKLCQRLSQRGEGDLMITPPLMVKPEGLSRLAQLNLPFAHQAYEHVYQEGFQDRSVLIETLILPMTAEGQVGHA